MATANDALPSVVALLTVIDATVATTVRPFAARDAVDIAVAVCIASKHPDVASRLFPHVSLVESCAKLMSCACAGELDSIDGLSSSFAAVGLSLAISSSTNGRGTTTAPAPLRLRSATEFRGSVDVVILTIRQDEHEAVSRRLFDARSAKGRRFYTIGALPMAHGRDACVVLLRIPESGTGPAQDAARDAIEDFAPHLIALVGIGGAVPSSEFSLGDVMLTTRLADLRLQALRYGASPQPELRGERVQKALADLLVNLPAVAVEGWSSATSLGCAAPQVPLDEERFDGPEAFRSKVRESLERRFGERRLVRPPLYWTGTTGSSDSLVRDPDAVAHWQEACRKIEVFEMEAAGVFEAAARPDKTYPVLVVRGVSDVIGYRRDPDWTAYACDAAAAFAAALISSGLLETIRS
jgi:nucleoside phosphorylase